MKPESKGFACPAEGVPSTTTLVTHRALPSGQWVRDQQQFRYGPVLGIHAGAAVETIRPDRRKPVPERCAGSAEGKARGTLDSGEGAARTVKRGGGISATACKQAGFSKGGGARKGKGTAGPETARAKRGRGNAWVVFRNGDWPGVPEASGTDGREVRRRSRITEHFQLCS